MNFLSHTFIRRLIATAIYAVITCGLSITEEAKGYEYEASGWVDATTYVNGGKPKQIKQVYFNVYVNGCSWLIRSSSIGSSDPILYHEVSSDGIFIYSFGKNRNANLSHPWGGSIKLDGVPFFGPVPMAPVVWLALADGCYLNENAHSMTPPYSTDTVLVPFTINTTRIQDGLGLPELISFMDDGYDRRDGQLSKKWPAPFDQGFTNAVYLATDFTNIGGIKLPKEFNLQVLGPVRPKSVGEKALALSWLFKGYVTNISPSCSISNFVPEIPSNTTGIIIDERFSPKSAIVPIEYIYKASNWLSMEDAHSLPQFAKYQNSQAVLTNFIPIGFNHAAISSMPGPITPYARAITIGLLVITSLFGLALLFTNSKKSNHTKP